MPDVHQDAEAPSLERILGVVRRRLPLIVICVLVVAGAAFAVSKHQTRKYTATASLVFSNNSLSQQIAGLSVPSQSSSTLLIQQANNLALVKGGDMAAKTARRLGHGLTTERVLGDLSIKGLGESGVVAVSATSTSPSLAAAIVNVYTEQFVAEQQSANRHYFKSALALIHKQLSKLTPQQRVGPVGAQLQNRAQTLTLLSELNYGNVQLAQRALPPSSPSSPKTSRNTALGLLLGLLIGLGLAFVLERLDRRIKSVDDLEAVYGLPLLGSVPENAELARSARSKRGKRAALSPVEAEAFSLIRAHLRFFNVDRELRVIAVASAAPGEGKTTIARHLAEAAARLGSRVLLLELNLRKPTLARHLDIQPGPGLADVLIGAVTIDEAIRQLPFEHSPGEVTGRTLDVLPAGEVLPPNPAALLASHAMETVLTRVSSTYDLVLIDTPPLTAVSDAFPLLPKVDGVVIVGWVARSRRDAAERLRRVLAGSGARLLGIVANGSKSRRPSSYPNTPEGKLPISGPVSPNGVSPSEEGLVPTAKA